MLDTHTHTHELPFPTTATTKQTLKTVGIQSHFRNTNKIGSIIYFFFFCFRQFITEGDNLETYTYKRNFQRTKFAMQNLLSVLGTSLFKSIKSMFIDLVFSLD